MTVAKQYFLEVTNEFTIVVQKNTPDRTITQMEKGFMKSHP